MGDTNEPTNLAEYVKTCEDVAELHEIAKEKFGETIHNRTGLEKSRERVLELIDGKEPTPADQTASASSDDQANAGSAAPVPGDQEPEELETEPQAETVTISRAEYEDLLIRAGDKERTVRGGPGSKLKNTRTGRVFAWTAALAKNKNMVEVEV